MIVFVSGYIIGAGTGLLLLMWAALSLQRRERHRAATALPFADRARRVDVDLDRYLDDVASRLSCPAYGYSIRNALHWIDIAEKALHLRDRLNGAGGS